MFLAIGLTIVFGSILLGYTMEGGNVMVLVQIAEFVIIIGCALGAVLLANTPSIIVGMIKGTIGLLKPSGFNRKAYTELLQVLYELFYTARKDGLMGIESHVESPETSELFKKYPVFHRKKQAPG